MSKLKNGQDLITTLTRVCQELLRMFAICIESIPSRMRHAIIQKYYITQY
jgi:hypothetical protein